MRDLPPTPLWTGRVPPEVARPLSPAAAAATIAAAKPTVPWSTGPGGATALPDDDDADHDIDPPQPPPPGGATR
jgi:hypothetical protein